MIVSYIGNIHPYVACHVPEPPSLLRDGKVPRFLLRRHLRHRLRHYHIPTPALYSSHHRRLIYALLSPV